MLGVWQGSAAQHAAELAPEGVGVVSALHTVSAAALTLTALLIGMNIRFKTHAGIRITGLPDELWPQPAR